MVLGDAISCGDPRKRTKAFRGAVGWVDDADREEPRGREGRAVAVNIVGSAYCPVDQRQVPLAPAAERKRTNHILHLLLTVFTLGLWGIVWIIVAAVNAGSGQVTSAYCTNCGTPFRLVEQGRWVPAQSTQNTPPAGWYPDPARPTEIVRFWTGEQWTEHTKLRNDPELPP